jgi:cytochrome b561
VVASGAEIVLDQSFSSLDLRLGGEGALMPRRATMTNGVIRNQYGPISRLLHWLTVLLVFLAWALGTFGEDLFGKEEESAGAAAGLNLHIWAGLAILMIAAFRFPWRIVNPPPPTEANEFSRWLISWTDPAARITHYALYVLLFVVPIAGILLQFSRGHALSLFGFAEIVSPFSANRGLAHNLKELHEVLANLLVVIAVFHASAAVIHHVVFRDNTLLRMAPWLRKGDPKLH